jgi:hypothetical protein
MEEGADTAGQISIFTPLVSLAPENRIVEDE